MMGKLIENDTCLIAKLQNQEYQQLPLDKNEIPYLNGNIQKQEFAVFE